MTDALRYHITDIPSEKCFIKPPYQRNSSFLCMRIFVLIPDGRRCFLLFVTDRRRQPRATVAKFD